MKQDFNFDKIGKREPYRVPEGFFDELRETLEQRVTPRPRSRWLRWGSLMTGVASVAAVFALLLSGTETSVEPKTQVYTMTDVEQTFDRLCEADQNYLMDIYYQDTFLEGE